MKILFVWPVCTFSVWDVARGYHGAFTRLLGEENIRDYRLDWHHSYHRRALPDMKDNITLSQYSSQTILNEAVYFDADVVFIVSGLNIHPIALWALNKVGIHAAAVLTESPYQDVDQADWASTYPGMTVFTNERTSAEKYGWHYLQHAYDPKYHYPHDPEYKDECDVLMVGTGWADRQAMLEAIDWTGVDLRLHGIWPTVTSDSPLYDSVWPVCVNNVELPSLYAGAKICINIHRGSEYAESLNPRAYEIPACGAFQLSDWRPELDDVFRGTVPTFDGPKQLAEAIRYYLSHDDARRGRIEASWEAVRPHTFDARAIDVLDILRRECPRLQADRGLHSEQEQHV